MKKLGKLVSRCALSVWNKTRVQIVDENLSRDIIAESCRIVKETGIYLERNGKPIPENKLFPSLGELEKGRSKGYYMQVRQIAVDSLISIGALGTSLGYYYLNSN